MHRDSRASINVQLRINCAEILSTVLSEQIWVMCVKFFFAVMSVNNLGEQNLLDFFFPKYPDVFDCLPWCLKQARAAVFIILEKIRVSLF